MVRAWATMRSRSAALATAVTMKVAWLRVAGEIEFEWDDENQKHPAAHRAVPAELEQVVLNDPIDLAMDWIRGGERCRFGGCTDGGRMLALVWTIRDAASLADKRVFWEKLK